MFVKKRLKVMIFMLVMLNLLFSNLMYSETIEDNIEMDYKMKGTIFYLNENYDSAYNVLKEGYFSSKTYDKEVLLLLGEIADLMQNYEERIKYYKLITNSEPENIKAKFQLVKAYLKIPEKYLIDARQELNSILIMDIDEEMKNTVLTLSKNLKEKQKIPKNWFARLALGYIYNDNVTTEISTSGAEENIADNGIGLSALAAYYLKLSDNFIMQPIIRYDGDIYMENQEESINRTSISLESSYSYKNYTFSLPIISSLSYIGGDKNDFSIGSMFRIKYLLNKNISIAPTLEYYLIKNDIDQYDETLNSFGGYLKMGDEQNLYVKLNSKYIIEDYEATDSDDSQGKDFMNNNAVLTAAELGKTLPYDTYMSLYLEFLRRTYDDFVVSVGDSDGERTDEKISVNINFIKKYKAEKIDVIFGINYSDNNSSKNEYDIETTKFTLQISKIF